MGFTEKIKIAVNDFLDRRYINQLQGKVRLIALERKDFKSWSDKELRLAALAFRDDLEKGKELDDILVSAFAVANEAARRVLGQVPYDVQVLGGIAIHQGKVAEMKAGEGKTLTETMPVYLNALAGKGVHIITTNDYLAERDAKWMEKLYDFLGLKAAFVSSSMDNSKRREAYAADITYVTNQEVGFDFLRDNLVYSRADRVLRKESPLHFGIVDEIDSILIDESRTPLIIAQPVKEDRMYYDKFIEIVSQLEEGKDFEVDYRHKNISITEDGYAKVENILGEPIFSKEKPSNAFYLDVCLRAQVLFEKNRDYIVSPEGLPDRQAGVEIVDEFTGRVLPGRRFTDGVHQAIEAKEKVKIKESDKTAASITFQNFFPMYEKLSGMSGTVMQSRDEFHSVYKLEVVQIPTNRPMARVEHNDLFFKTKKGKFQGLAKKLRKINSTGQPILIGSRNVQVAEEVAEILKQSGFSFQLLTASNHRAEAEKIKNAGQKGMITVATNMAGRGTDIILADEVKSLGLFVIGTERHESRRIDDQLVGRAGRQGEPGDSQFLISMEDEIMQLFGSERIIDAMEEIDIEEDEYISGPSLDEAFAKAQNFIEHRNYDGRVYLYKYDRVVNYQRDQVYRLREELLENRENFENFYKQAVENVLAHTFNLLDAEKIHTELKDVFTLNLPVEELELRLSGKLQDMQKKADELALSILPEILNASEKIYSDKELLEAGQSLVLQVIDESWSGHLELMDILKEEANLFSYASVDPLMDFIEESRSLFTELGRKIERDFIQKVFKVLDARN